MFVLPKPFVSQYGVFCGLISFLLLLITNSVAGQDQTLPQPIPPSPTASSLGKYGEIPVGKYTGVADVSIPIWEIENGDIKIPISLSYHASGVKIEDIASWVGLGWSLNAGGVITRSVMGKPDENGYQNMNIPNVLVNPQPSPAYCDTWTAALYLYLVGGKSYGFDSEPDTYYFNFNGISGRFVFDQNGVPYTIPYQNIKIERTGLTDWKITTPDGMVYKFGGAYIERSDVYNVSYSYYGESANKNKTLSNSSMPSSWYLYEINSPNGRTVTFEYSNEDYETVSGISQQVLFNTTSTSTTTFTPSNSGTITRFYAKKLSQINFGNGSVKFIASSQKRKDLSLNGLDPNAYALEKIAVYDGNNRALKVFKFDIDYFQSDDPIQTYNTQRLRLKALTEFSGAEQSSKTPHTFSYEETFRLPSRLSASQDHWGYFNGKQNLDSRGYPTLIPSQLNNYSVSVAVQQAGGAPLGYSITPGPYRCYDLSAPSCNILVPNIRTFQFTGADRSSNFAYAKTGILKKIKYPTGGFSSFEYEPNDYDLKNYLYKQGTGGVIAFATCCDPVNNPVVRSGNQYMVTKTLLPNQLIPADLRAKNPTVPFSLQFSANLDGYDNKCCKGCSTPYAYFKDVTANKLLIEVVGLTNTTTIGDAVIDPSIKDQFNSGTAKMTKAGNTINISELVLDPAHTYELFSRAATCPGESCNEFPDCPGITRNMEMYTSAGFFYQTNTVEQYNGEIGGIRISKISNYTSDNDDKPLIKKYLYRVSSDVLNRISSGVVLDLPQYYDVRSVKNFFLMWKYIGGQFGLFANLSVPVIRVANTSNQYVLTSGSKFALGQTSGAFVGYREVQEYICPDNTCGSSPVGKKIYSYTSPDNYTDKNAGVFGDATVNGSYENDSPCPAPGSSSFSLQSTLPSNVDFLDNIYPYPPKTSFDWKRGLLLSEATYDANNVRKQLIENDYNLVDEALNRKVIPAVKIVSDPTAVDPTNNSHHFFFAKYEIVAAWNYQKSQKVTNFNSDGTTIVTTKNFYYDNPLHAQQTRIESIDSKGTVLKETFNYVGDEASLPNQTATESTAITKLKSQFRYGTLLQHDYTSGTNLIKRTRTRYKDWGNNLIMPEANQEQVGNNAMEDRLNYLSYDNNNGNLTEVKKTGDISTAFVWGYAGKYPIAECKNASPSEVYLQNYEESTTNTLSGIAHTGLKYSSSPSISWTRPNTREFVISYWYRSDGKWIYRPEQPYLGPTFTMTGGDGYDDVRIHPKDALITTYTYQPLIGMTSMTDVKCNTTYYEYDDLLRLKTIKDQDGKIVKKTEYHYKGQ